MFPQLRPEGYLEFLRWRVLQKLARCVDEFDGDRVAVRGRDPGKPQPKGTVPVRSMAPNALTDIGCAAIGVPDPSCRARLTAIRD